MSLNVIILKKSVSITCIFHEPKIAERLFFETAFELKHIEQVQYFKYDSSMEILF